MGADGFLCLLPFPPFFVFTTTQGMTTPKVTFQSDFPRWHALSMRMVAGVGVLSFPSAAELKSTFVTSKSPAEVGWLIFHFQKRAELIPHTLRRQQAPPPPHSPRPRLCWACFTVSLVLPNFISLFRVRALILTVQ